MKPSFLLICAAALFAGCATTDISDTGIQATAATLDYGDSSSQTLVNKAWKAAEKKKDSELFAYTQRCVELYGEQGKQMNAELSGFEPAASAAEKWALNDVGTCPFIMATAYEQLKMYPEATQAYRTLADDFQYSQCWDPKGWFWRPADGAARKAQKYRNWN